MSARFLLEPEEPSPAPPAALPPTPEPPPASPVLPPPEPVPPTPPAITPPEPQPAPIAPITTTSPRARTASVAAEPRRPRPPAPAPPAAASGPAAGTGAPSTSARPRYASNPPPQYPPEAKRLRQQGEALIRVKVGPDGRALDVALKRSSGFPSLDEAALAAVRRWRFEPARTADVPIAAEVDVPVRFQLKT